MTKIQKVLTIYTISEEMNIRPRNETPVLYNGTYGEDFIG